MSGFRRIFFSSFFLITYSVCLIQCHTPCAYFNFPTLTGNKFITDKNSDVDLPFSVVQTCADVSRIAITKENDGSMPRCMFLLGEQCLSNDNSSCRCPEDGTDLYHFLLPADPSNNGTWVWSAKPAVTEDTTIHYCIDILVIGVPPTTPSIPEENGDTTPEENGDTSPATVKGNVEGKKQTEPPSTTVLVAVSACFVAVVIVAITLTIICRLSSMVKTFLTRTSQAAGGGCYGNRGLRYGPGAALHDLYRGSNVSVMITNPLYEGSSGDLSTQGSDHPAAGGACGYGPVSVEHHTTCRAPPEGALEKEDLYVTAEEVRRMKREQRQQRHDTCGDNSTVQYNNTCGALEEEDLYVTAEEVRRMKREQRQQRHDTCGALEEEDLYMTAEEVRRMKIEQRQQRHDSCASEEKSDPSA